MADAVPLFVLIPNYVLAALMYTLLGRFVLSLLFPTASGNYIWRAFVRLTDPILAVARQITPAAVPHPVLLIFAAIWMLVVRIVFIMATLDSVQAS